MYKFEAPNKHLIHQKKFHKMIIFCLNLVCRHRKTRCSIHKMCLKLKNLNWVALRSITQKRWLVWQTWNQLLEQIWLILVMDKVQWKVYERKIGSYLINSNKLVKCLTKSDFQDLLITLLKCLIHVSKIFLKIEHL